MEACERSGRCERYRRRRLRAGGAVRRGKGDAAARGSARAKEQPAKQLVEQDSCMGLSADLTQC